MSFEPEDHASGPAVKRVRAAAGKDLNAARACMPPVVRTKSPERSQDVCMVSAGKAAAGKAAAGQNKTCDRLASVQYWAVGRDGPLPEQTSAIWRRAVTGCSQLWAMFAAAVFMLCPGMLQPAAAFMQTLSVHDGNVISDAVDLRSTLADRASDDSMMWLVDNGFGSTLSLDTLRTGPESTTVPMSLSRRPVESVIFEHHAHDVPELFSYIHEHRGSNIVTPYGVLPVFICLDHRLFWLNPLHHVHSDEHTFYFYPDARSVAAYLAGDVAAAATSGQSTVLPYTSSGDPFALSTLQTRPGHDDLGAPIPIATIGAAIAKVKGAGASLFPDHHRIRAPEGDDENLNTQEMVDGYPTRHKPRFVDGRPYMEDVDGDNVIDIPDDSHYIYLYTSFVMHNLLKISCELENRGCEQRIAYASDMNRNFNPAWESQENEIWARSSSFYYGNTIAEEKQLSDVQSVRAPGVSAMATSHAASAHSLSIRKQAQSIRELNTPYGAEQDLSDDSASAIPGILLDDQDMSSSSSGIYIGVLNARSFERYERFNSYIRRDLVPFSFGQQYIGRVSGREYEAAWNEYIDRVNSVNGRNSFGSGCYISAAGYYMTVFGNSCIPYGGFERIEARASDNGTLSAITVHSRLSPTVDKEDFINFLSMRYDRFDPYETAVGDVAVLYEEICSAMKELSEDRYNCEIYWFRDHNNYLKVTYGVHDDNRTLSLLFADESFLFGSERKTLNRRLASIRNEIKVKNHMAINGPARSYNSTAQVSRDSNTPVSYGSPPVIYRAMSEAQKDAADGDEAENNQ